MIHDRLKTRTRVAAVATLTVALVAGAAPLAANAAGYPSDTTAPDLVPLLSGYDSFWQPSGSNDLHGTVLDAATLARNDELVTWINNNATQAQRFTALQDSEYQNTSNTAYDQSVTISDALGSVLGPLYVTGRNSGELPLTSALINSSNGTSGAYVGTGAAKAHFSYPRPYLPTDPNAQPVSGDAAACAPSLRNGSSLAGIRTGKSYADGAGDLKIVRVPDTVDSTHRFSSNDVALSAGYGSAGICGGGSYPSGHTTTAYQAGITLATLLPEFAPEILARASEAGNDRIVLGVHYPLDIIGGRIDGEAALAARWSDSQYRAGVLEPARAELVAYLEKACGGALASCAARGTAYRDDPYGGAVMPGGTAQIVNDRGSALAVYTERMTYGFAATGKTGLAPSVPAGASNLLLTSFPTLTDAQRSAVLAATEIGSGYPLDRSASSQGSWQRLNLAAAMSATVRVAADGAVSVLSTGGVARVVHTGSLSLPSGSTVAAGGTLALHGTGFAPGATYRIVLHSDPVTLATVTADASGAFALAVTIPAATVAGGHAIDVVDTANASALAAPVPISVTVAGTVPAGAATAGTTDAHLPVVSG